jgi:hypothetical protein
VLATGVQFLSHVTSGTGGAVRADNSDIEMISCTFDGNRAGSTGGGLFVQGGTLVLHSSALVNNQSSSFGGALYANQNAPELHNLTVSGNSGGAGSGLCLANVQPGAVMRNSILAFNSLGALVVSGGSPPLLNWNLYWQNGGLDVLGGTQGTQDLTVDPLLVASPSDDLHLGLHSPALDSGDPAVLDPDGSRSDRGAFGGPAARPLAPPRTVGLRLEATRGGARLTWDASPSTVAVQYRIYRGDHSDFQPDSANLIAQMNAPLSSWQDRKPTAGTWYKVNAVDPQGRAGGYSLSIEQQPRIVVPDRSRHELVLEPIYPNPTNPSATIAFALPHDMPVQVHVFDARGRRIRQLATGVHRAGAHRLSWDGRSDDGQASASGVYWIRMHTALESFSRKLILVR